MKVGVAPFRGEAMAELINPTNGYRGSLKKRGIEPKDHIAANKKQLQKSEKEIAAFKNLPPPSDKQSKMKQFTQIPAKTMNRPRTARPTSQTPDFIKQNIHGAITMKPKVYTIEPTKDFRDTYADYGRVPEFLTGIKDDLHLKKMQKAFEADKKKWPKGYKMLSTQEKEQKLLSLGQEREQLIKELGDFKFSADSNLRKDQRSAKEKRLNEIEFELRRLSLVKVFVPN